MFGKKKEPEVPKKVIKSLCPHCDKDITEVDEKYVESSEGSTVYLFSCPHCNKVIGTSFDEF